MSLGIGLASLAYNIKKGNVGAALLDTVGVVADAAALAIPGVPGGAGAAIKAGRAAKATAQALKARQGVKALQAVDRAINVGQGIGATAEAAAEGRTGSAVLSGGLTALGIGGANKATRELTEAVSDAGRVQRRLPAAAPSNISQAQKAEVRVEAPQRQPPAPTESPRLSEVATETAAPPPQPITEPSRLLAPPSTPRRAGGPAATGPANARRGNAFEREVLAALGTSKNTSAVSEISTRVTTVPDLPLNSRFGVADVKDVLTLSNSKQLRAQLAAAETAGQPFSIIISPRTRKISRPLQERIRFSGGKLIEYDAVTGRFNAVTLRGNKVIRSR